MSFPSSISDTIILSNGVKMPVLGLGAWLADDPDELVAAMKIAFNAGYRMVDTASQYGNEVSVGRGIRESGLDRSDIFISTKMFNKVQKEGDIQAMIDGFEGSLEALGTDYVDLYLMHWPLNENKKFIEAWKAMIEIYRSGKARAIGVCNCHIHNLEDMCKATGVMPMVNQCECHPSMSQKEMIAYCTQNGVQFECFSPLMHGKLVDMPELSAIAIKYGKTPAQIILRWHIQNGLVVIPKSVHEVRICENAGIFDFSLEQSEVAYIDSLNKDERILPDPDLDLTFMPPPPPQ